MSLIDANGLACVYYNNDDPSQGISSWTNDDCPTDANGNPTDNGVYVDSSNVQAVGQDSNGDLVALTTDGDLINPDGSIYSSASVIVDGSDDSSYIMTYTLSLSSGGYNASIPAPNNGTPTPTPSPTPTPTPEQGNSWSHPFTPPTCHQWTLWAASDGAISYLTSGAGKYWNPVSATFGGAAVIEAFIAAKVCP